MVQFARFSGFAIFAKQIQFGDGGKAPAVMGIDRFQAEKPSARRSGEFHVLTGGTRRKGTGVRRLVGGQVQRDLRTAAGSEVEFRPKLVENGFFQTRR